jgi:hypothetical protein
VCQDGQFEADLLATLPRGLITAAPGITLPVLFVATAQAKAGKSSRELVRMFGLSLRDAKTILAYTTTDGNERLPGRDRLPSARDGPTRVRTP